MKKILSLFIIATLSTSIYAQRKDLTPRVDIEGVLKISYNDFPKGTPILVMNVIKLSSDVQLAVSINNTQISIPSNQAKKIVELHPKTMEQFWMAEYIKSNMFEYYDNKGYRFALRQELTEESNDYLSGISDLYYKDAYIIDYVKTIFCGIAPKDFNKKRPEYADLKIIQSPTPYANMLANGTLLISTGLLTTLDSVEELTAIIASGIAHYVMDHPLLNVQKEISRARRAEFWGGFLVAVAGGLEIALTENNDNYIPGGILLTAAVADEALNYSAIKRLGMGYTNKQRKQADKIAVEFLKFANMDPAALTSALTKIRNYYQREHRQYNEDEKTFGNLNQRLADLGDGKEFSNRTYQKTMANVTTRNAIIQLNSHNYEAARRLVIKKINTNIANDEDYVVLVKANMELTNTQEGNERCLELIQEAKVLSDIPNLELYKQEILVLLRLNKQAKATDVLKEYVALLTDFKAESTDNDAEWAMEEIQWANKLYQQLEMF
ncbi:M48 family metalloprotease [Bacteroides sp. 519]|uniref:M48 family metalloprotease n=1 Tax=Bacteroides sp. 519 TaxID=2302937 RepID=UPI0013D00036|nr:M48 family metalloprotease [Bacteroides sp. 519]NDV56976.1 peptidase M48 [Bacteroides sp. 519]